VAKNWPTMDAEEHDLQLRFPPANYPQLRQRGAGKISVRFDCSTSRSYFMDNTSIRTEADQDAANLDALPAHARTMSLQWLGVGVMRHVPLPQPALDPDGKMRVPRTVLMLPRWEPGATVSGSVLGADGQPLVKATLLIGTRLYWTSVGDQETVQLATDARGRFSVQGVLPGTLFIAPFLGQRSQTAGWTLTVPEAGLKDITLRIAANPLVISPLNRAAPANQEQQRAWWFPDGGTPSRLPISMGICASQELPEGSGWLWMTGGIRGQADYYYLRLRRTDMPGVSYRADQPFPGGPSLGLTFPFDPRAGMPGGVTLVGEGARAGVSATFADMFWQPCPMLGLTVAQITAVPPGQYRIIVETCRGPVEAPVTVTPFGGSVSLRYPEQRP
jgi:hypothetical protein